VVLEVTSWSIADPQELHCSMADQTPAEWSNRCKMSMENAFRTVRLGPLWCTAVPASKVTLLLLLSGTRTRRTSGIRVQHDSNAAILHQWIGSGPKKARASRASFS
jgi:hypothetical protein